MAPDFNFLKSLSFEVLNEKHIQSKTFHTDDGPLNDYYYFRALKDQNENFSVSEVALCNGEVIGYITTCADRIDLNEGEVKRLFAHNTPSYKNFGAVLVGRLDSHNDHRGKGIASLLVGRQINKVIKNNIGNHAPARFVTVDSYTKSIDYYKHLGFQESEQESKEREFRDQDTKKMYIDIFDRKARINQFMVQYVSEVMKI